jgi:hypothetical protein
MEAFGPFGPAARGVFALDCEDGCAVGRAGRGQRANLRRRHLEQAIDGGNEILRDAMAIEANHAGVTAVRRGISYMIH